MPAAKKSLATAVILPETEIPLSAPSALVGPRNIRRTQLPNGLLVLTESMPHLRSVSIGVWIGTGSRDELPELNGISHFVEHMLFKGTTSRSARQIAREVDAIGGNLDAFTSKENICFNIKVLDSNVPAALDILADLVLHPVFAPAEVAREQSVILEEIKMDEDNPDYLVHEIFTQAFWKGDGLGRPILGTKRTVPTFTQQTALSFHAERFTPANLILSAAGHLDHDRFVALAERHFGALLPSSPAQNIKVPMEQVRSFPTIKLRNKRSLEQSQLCIGVTAPPVAAPERFALYILNTILGGGMSSRLFQTIREERGLAYSIYSEVSPFRDTGLLAVYAGCAAEKATEILRLTLTEFTRLKNEPVSREELTRAKDQMKGNIVLGLESSASRMANLARQQGYFGRFYSVDEVTHSIDAVTAAEIRQLARTLFQPDAIGLALLGNLQGLTITRDALAC